MTVTATVPGQPYRDISSAAVRPEEEEGRPVASDEKGERMGRNMETWDVEGGEEEDEDMIEIVASPFLPFLCTPPRFHLPDHFLALLAAFYRPTPFRRRGCSIWGVLLWE